MSPEEWPNASTGCRQDLADAGPGDDDRLAAERADVEFHVPDLIHMIDLCLFQKQVHLVGHGGNDADSGILCQGRGKQQAEQQQGKYSLHGMGRASCSCQYLYYISSAADCPPQIQARRAHPLQGNRQGSAFDRRLLILRFSIDGAPIAHHNEDEYRRFRPSEARREV